MCVVLNHYADGFFFLRRGVIRSLVKPKILLSSEGEDADITPNSEFSLNTNYKR